MAINEIERNLPTVLKDHLVIFTCPQCQGDLQLSGDQLICGPCSERRNIEQGIPLLFWPTTKTDSISQVTDVMKSFYEKTPFPNYDDFDSGDSLKEKARSGLFARLLDEQIPNGARILEAGCGTGQLSNFLGLTWGRTIFATDMCLNSLRMAQKFKNKNQISNTAFIQMNLFMPVFKPESFDLVISNGVLHHTADPLLGFRSIAALVKPQGHILVGLYNKYGRISTDLRRLLYKISPKGFAFLDPRLRDRKLGETRKVTWFLDQYKNPHETKHTVDEVLGWFDQTGFEFVNAIPKISFGERLTEKEKLFEPHPKGSSLERLISQLSTMLKGAQEGGLFLVIGRKKTPGA